MTLLPALLLASYAHQLSLVQTFFDDTFAGVHRLDLFDWSLLVPYFVLLVILACYGCHRYEMIRRYLKHRQDLPTQPPGKLDTLPRVTIQLPLYNERYVVERLLEEVVKMDYPKHLLEIQVLDDSTDDTHPFTEALVRDYRAAGIPIEYIHRSNPHGYKAGTLPYAMPRPTRVLLAM